MMQLRAPIRSYMSALSVQLVLAERMCTGIDNHASEEPR